MYLNREECENMKIKQHIKKVVFESQFLYHIAKRIQSLLRKRSTVLIENHGLARLHKDVIGANNIVRIGKESTLYDTKILIHGNNNKIEFGENVFVGPDCSFWIEGNNCEIYIGNKTSFTMGVHFCVQEDGMSIKTGGDCMFSNSIIVRTSDSHPIYNDLKQRINNAKSVMIGNHVWIAPNSKVMKGVTIGDDAIIGSDTIVTKDVPAASCAVGHPARVVKSNIEWTREHVF